MAKQPNITVDELRQLLSYDSDTGVFTHNQRPLSMFSATWRHTAEHGWRRWNTKFAGKRAGGIDKTHGYLKLQLVGNTIYGHHAAWAYVHGYWSESEIDHKNNEPSDNRIENLRVATSSQQKQNRRAGKFSKQLPKGVGWHTQRNKYRAYLGQKHLGLFDTVEEAKEAYDRAASAQYGEFAKIA
jgi:hypothetical protein